MTEPVGHLLSKPNLFFRLEIRARDIMRKDINGDPVRKSRQDGQD